MIAYVLGLIAALTLATAPAPTSPRIDAKSRRALVDVLGRQIQSRYVFPDSASRIQAFLKKRVASGAYDTAATTAVLGRLLTDDLHPRFARPPRGGAGGRPRPQGGPNRLLQRRMRRRCRSTGRR